MNMKALVSDSYQDYLISRLSVVRLTVIVQPAIAVRGNDLNSLGQTCVPAQ